jgi:hypothetical protein
MKISDDQSILAWGLQPEDAVIQINSLSQSRDFHHHGPLAEDPEQFRWSGDISSTGSTGHYSMTNQGLEIALPIGRHDFGLLDCTLRGKEEKLVAICLRRLPAKNANRYIRQSRSGASTMLLPFGEWFRDCLDFEHNTITISGASGAVPQVDWFSEPSQMITHQWLRLKMSGEFKSDIAMVYNSDEPNCTVLNRRDSSNSICWSLEPAALPDRLVILSRLRRSDMLVWVFLENGWWSYVHRDGKQFHRTKPIAEIATERSLDIDKFFNHPKLHAFGRVLLEPSNMLIRASIQKETIYNHQYTQVDLQYQLATASDIAACRVKGLSIDSEDQDSRQQLFDSCCSGAVPRLGESILKPRMN